MVIYLFNFGGDFMVIKDNTEIEVGNFLSDLHRSELDSYTPDELRAFFNGFRCAFNVMQLCSISEDDIAKFLSSDFVSSELKKKGES